jgi:hypothetical protein
VASRPIEAALAAVVVLLTARLAEPAWRDQGRFEPIFDRASMKLQYTVRF